MEMHARPEVALRSFSKANEGNTSMVCHMRDLDFDFLEGASGAENVVMEGRLEVWS
jgi:hypothetical protein